MFPAAGYFSMAIEAVTQLADPAEPIANYVLRDVAVRKALVTPDDDGVEVVLSMRRAEAPWWDFAVAVNARPHRPAPARPGARLTHRASGREWNRALRAVGFDYGPTFADMADVAFNGRDAVCTCRTCVKTTAGTMAAESRHALHPATVDSTLQLMIASVYAGRSGAMAAGIVPVHVDEVAVWPPTEEQLSDARALA